MAVNEGFALFVIKLAIDDDFRARFKADRAGTLAGEPLSDEDRLVLLTDDDIAYRVQIENVQVSGVVTARAKAGRAGATRRKATKGAGKAKPAGRKRPGRRTSKKR